MPKSINAAIGTCECPICGAQAEVRKYKQTKKLDPDPSDAPSRWSGRLYLYCPAKCKTVKFENQDWILENATITGEGAPPATPAALPAPAGEDPLPAPPDPPPDPPAKPAAEPAPEPKKSRVGDWFL